MKKNCAQTAPFTNTRKHHSLELAEDYVEIIYDFIRVKNEAKVSDIARHLGVSHVTVIRTLERLKKKGYVLLNKNQPVTLTDAGLKLALFSKERHLFLMNYLVTLGVPEEVAAIDVEGMEHHVSATTIEVLRQHLEQLSLRHSPFP